MNVQRIRECLRRLEKYLSFQMPAMGWRFVPAPPDGALAPGRDARTCLFAFVREVARGKRLCLSAEQPGCGGAACYLGFRKPSPDAGAFLADKERFKKTAELGRAFYEEIRPVPAPDRYAVLERIEDTADGPAPEIVVLWIGASSLAGLVTLANYDRPTNDNVIIPFASGCQSIWTIPYREAFEKLSRCVVGAMDPAVRYRLPKDVLTFSMPAGRFVEMAEHADGSFLRTPLWSKPER